MKPCSKCKGTNDRPGQRYCRACHAAYMRENRPKHSELSGEARFKANVRAMTRTYELRGRLERKPCEVCGSDNAERHHLDYNQPLLIQWLCRECHLDHHRGERTEGEGSKRPAGQRCMCDPRSWSGTPNAICSDCKPDPVAPKYCMNCEHNIECHERQLTVKAAA